MLRARSLSLLAAALIAPAAFVAACGEEEQERPPSVPAAGENTPPAGTPGVPEGAPYDLDGTEWTKLAQKKQFAAAQAYIDENPDRCKDAFVGDVAFYVTNSYGTDFPLDIPAADVLAEGCAAAIQS